MSTNAWLKILDGWGNQKDPIKRFKCPYCGQKFKTLSGAQGHWAVKHEKFGLEKPSYDHGRGIVGKKKKKVPLKEAIKKAKKVKHRIHRNEAQCEKAISEYETALQTMTAAQYKKQSGISKQTINNIRKRLRKLKEK